MPNAKYNAQFINRKWDVIKVRIEEVNSTINPPIAKGKDLAAGGIIDIDIRSATSIPKIGEVWWLERSTGNWRLGTFAGSLEESLANNQVSTEDVGAVSVINGGNETITAIGNSGPAKTLFAVGSGNIHTVTLNDNCVFTLSSDLSEGARTFTLIITGSSGYTATFTDVLWDSASPPVISDNIDILRFMTTDGGTTWYGFIEAQDMA